MRIAINGFGRIGRTFLRTICADPQAAAKLNVIAINIGGADPEQLAHMFKYDTIMGTFPGHVQYEDQTLIIDDWHIDVIAQLDPAELDWGSLGIDWVVDASGKYTSAERARLHLDAGAQHVLITALCKGPVITIVPGVNDDQFNSAKDKLVSLASCTTNALMPMLKVLHEAFGITGGFVTTVHAYTNTQCLLDVETGDLRRSRAAALNIIPTSTGAARMIDLVMPELAERIEASALRVPVANVSLLNVMVHTEQSVDPDLINETFRAAAHADLKGICAVSNEPLVSSDYMGDPYSVTIDAPLTQAKGHLSNTFGWYDNEWGYSERLKDFLLHIAGR